MENKIRIQPEMMEIPERDPFANDLLERRTSIEALTNVISNIEGPCVMAVDAPWGMGKTTFIRMWEQYLRNKKFPVASFNAWETDYFADPFSALSGELLQELQNFEKNLLKNKGGLTSIIGLEKLREAVRSVPRKTLPILIRGISDVAGAGLIGIAAQITEAHIEANASDPQNVHKALEKFRKTLKETADVLAEKTEQRSLVIVIDELDRCRPSYAIELLEIAKHFFSVEHIVFVLAVNFSELSHSVCSVYGEQFNAQSYLERFFDVDFKLPDNDRARFIQANFGAMKINQYFKQTEDENAEKSFPAIAKVLIAFFTKAHISLRKISQVMRRLGLIVAALPSDRMFLGWASVIALMIRTIDHELYERFVGRNASDQEVIDSIFSRPEFKDIRNRHEGNLFEAVIIVSHAELRTHEEIQEGTLSTLYQTYKDWDELDPETSVNDEKGRDRAVKIMRIVAYLEQETYMGRRATFEYAAKCIELFSADLVQKDASQD